MSEWVGWHFVAADRRLRWPLRRGEPRPVVQPGMTLRVEGPPVLCKWGLHASRRGLDALKYAPGPTVCRVQLGGEVVEAADKAVATERTVLWIADATRVLHEFALWCASRALTREREAGREPGPRAWAALEVKRRWLEGEATDEELVAAWDAASGDVAGWNSAFDDVAAWDAAFDAVATARDAATADTAAAWDAASGGDPVFNVVAETAVAAARAEQADRLDQMLLALGPGEEGA